MTTTTKTAHEMTLQAIQKRFDCGSWDSADLRFLYARAESQAELLEALVTAVPWVVEYGSHQHKQCYRGSDDGCYCGLTEARKVVEAAIQKAGGQ